MTQLLLDRLPPAWRRHTGGAAGRDASVFRTAQAKAVALVEAWQPDAPDPNQELAALREIEADGFAAGLVAAYGHDVTRRIAILENVVRSLCRVDAIEAHDTAVDVDAPPHGADWCRHGCQPLFGMECGVCGYDGPGVRADEADAGEFG